MSQTKTVAQVRVLKNPHGNPIAEIAVDTSIGADKLAAVIDKAMNSQELYRVGGLKPCACKSGFDINIVDRYVNVVEIEV